MVTNKCATPGCKNNARKKGIHCETCHTRFYRNKYKIKYCWRTLYDNAKRRKKEFTLTLEEFTEFVLNTGYMKGKGLSSESLTIDRIDNERGYTIDNIRVITKSENSSKGAMPYEEIIKDVPF